MTLNCSVDRGEFAAGVTWVAKHLPTRPALPHLGCVLLRASGGQLELHGSDGDVAASVRIPAGGEVGEALVSARLLASLVSTLPRARVDLEVQGPKLLLSCGRAQMTLPVVPPGDYPTLPMPEDSVGSVDGGTFASLVERVGLAADRAGERGLRWLHGVYLKFGPDLEAQGSDRYRAAIGTAPWVGRSEGTALVPSPALIDAAKGFSGSAEVSITLNEGSIGFADGHRSLAIRLLAEKFPDNLHQLLPARSDPPVVVSVPELAEALKRADLIRAPKTAAKLTVDGDVLSIEAQGEDASATTVDEVDCKYTGEPLSLSVNPQYLAEGLAALRSETVEISVTAPRKPLLLTAPGDDSYRHTIVPIIPL